MKTYIKDRIINITHNDLDGIGSPIVLSYYFDVEPYYCGYHEVEPLLDKLLDDMNSGKRREITGIVISDISFRESSNLAERVERFNNCWRATQKHKSLSHFITVRDHHASSGYLNKYKWAYSKETDSKGKKKCGTQLVYDMLRKRGSNSSLREFVKLVNLWDTWRWIDDFKKPFIPASDLNLLYSTKGKTWFFKDCIKSIRNNQPVINESDKILIKSKRLEIEDDVKNKNRELYTIDFHYHTKPSQMDFLKGYVSNYTERDLSYLFNPSFSSTLKCGVVFASKNLSSVGNGLAELHPELDFIALVSLPNKISLRSLKDLDVPLGVVVNYITGTGGGHPKSAGASFANLKSESLIQDLFREQTTPNNYFNRR